MLNDTLIAAREASRRLNLTEHADTDKLLERLAENTVRCTGEILTANKHDLERMERNSAVLEEGYQLGREAAQTHWDDLAAYLGGRETFINP